MNRYSRVQFKTVVTQLDKMLEIHVNQQALDADEAHIMHGAISYKTKEAKDIMTPVSDMFLLPIS